MNPSEKFTDLGGQLPDENDRERGRRHIADLKARLAATPPPSPIDPSDEPQEAEQ